MRRRRHALQVSTFPFLAVLLCTMGSLILLLLVIDRRAKAMGRARAALALAEKTQSQPEKVKEDEWAEARRRLHESLEEELQEVRGKAEEIGREMGKANTDVANEQAQIQQLHEGLAAEKNRYALLARSLAARTEELAGTDKQDKATKEARRKMTADLVTLEQTLADLAALRKREQRTFSVVPYKGHRGENRKPVYLECTATGWTLHPDLKSFFATEEGIQSLRAELKSRVPTSAAGKDSGAYVFLLVRPDGIGNYYRAQAAMQGLPVDFGYEFVDASWILDFSEKPTAVAEPAPRHPAPELAVSRPLINSVRPGPPYGALANPGAPPGIRGSGSGRPVAGPTSGAIPFASIGSSPSVGPQQNPSRDRQGAVEGGPPVPNGRGSDGVSDTGNAAARQEPRSPSLASPLEVGKGESPPHDAAVIGRPRASFEDAASPGNGAGNPTLIGAAVGSGTAPGGGSAPSVASHQDSSRDQQNPSRERQGAVEGGPPLPNGRGSDGDRASAIENGHALPDGRGSDSPPDDDPSARLLAPPLPRLPMGRASKANESAAPGRPIRLTGNRDWIIPLDCTADAVTLPGGARVSAQSLGHGDSGSKMLLKGVQQLIERKQTTVRSGEPPYRPQVRFMVHPEGLRTYHLAYPALESLDIPVLRQNVTPADPAGAGGHTP